MPGKLFFLWTLIIIHVLTTPVQAQDSVREPSISTSQDPDAETPSLDLLEFLGEWETEDGEWIDPQELETMPLPDSKDDNDKPDK